MMRASNYDLMRKQSDPPMLESRHDFFNSIKLNIQCQNFSAGNASDEPMSAASFSAKGLGTSPVMNMYESPETLTPTLPGRQNSPRDSQGFYEELDRELLGDQNAPFFANTTTAESDQ